MALFAKFKSPQLCLTHATSAQILCLFRIIDGAKKKLVLNLHIPLFSYLILFSHTWNISLVPPTLFGIIISVVTNQQNFKLNINLYCIVKPSSDTYLTTAAGRLRWGDLLMGPPLREGERWPPRVGDGGITHYL